MEDTEKSPTLLQAIDSPIHDEVIKVTDEKVKEWIKLLPGLEQREVKIDLDSDPSPLANLSPDCLHHRYTEVQLNKWYREPTTDMESVDNFLQQILPRNDLRKFIGPLTAMVMSSLSTTITHLEVSVNSRSQAALLPGLHNLTNLSSIDVHVPNDVPPTAFTCPLPAIKYADGCSRVHLIVSDVDFTITSQINLLCNIVMRLQPTCGYTKIMFPRSNLNHEGFKTMVERLGRNHVSVWLALTIPKTDTNMYKDLNFDIYISNTLGTMLALYKEDMKIWERDNRDKEA